MSINRKTHAANTRVKMANFTLDSGLLGMDVSLALAASCLHAFRNLDALSVSFATQLEYNFT